MIVKQTTELFEPVQSKLFQIQLNQTNTEQTQAVMIYLQWSIEFRGLQSTPQHTPNNDISNRRSNWEMTMMASKHRTPGLPSPPTAIWRKPDINDKKQQTMEPVEMDLSITAQIPQMDITEYKIKKREQMDFSMTRQEPVEQV